MVARQGTAEGWVVELDNIINKYRNGEPRRAPITRGQAIKRLVELGCSEGDAARYLDRNRAKPAVSWK
jgi:hypothetical protein